MQYSSLITNTSGTNHFIQLAALIEETKQNLIIVSPFISYLAANSVIKLIRKNSNINSVIIYTLHPSLNNSNDPRALLLLSNIAKVYHTEYLHAKIYISDFDVALISSANFTQAGTMNNLECGLLTDLRKNNSVKSDLKDFINIIHSRSVPFTIAELKELSDNYKPLGSYKPNKIFFGNKSIDVPKVVIRKLSEYMTEDRLERRKLGYKAARDVLYQWKKKGFDNVKSTDLKTYFKTMNMDINKHHKESYGRFSNSILGKPLKEWSKTPSNFAFWIDRFLFGNPKESFKDYYNHKEPKLVQYGPFLWSVTLNIRNAQNYYVLLKESVNNVNEILGINDKLKVENNWDDYLEYCHRCSSIVNSLGIDPNFLDLFLTLYKRYINKQEL